MISTARSQWLGMFPHSSITYAYARAALSRHQLPPGKLIPLDVLEKNDRQLLLDRANQDGPIFKASAWNSFWICVVGLERCRRFLQQNRNNLRAQTIDLLTLFPKGFLRQLEGEDHARYRRALVRAIEPTELEQQSIEFQLIAANGLAECFAEQANGTDFKNPFELTLKYIATGMLIRLFFGAQFGSAFFNLLMTAFEELGPHGLVWNIKQPQSFAFASIKNIIINHLQLRPAEQGSESPGIVGRISARGDLDDTMIGNLIYMVEMGRYDMAGLFRWLCRYLAQQSEWSDRIRTNSRQGPEAKMSMAEAFVMETLRMDQSERLIRCVQRDLVFENFLIPKYATVRLCLWESHKSSAHFPEPFTFKPGRFLEQDFKGDQYSPFGLDHHRCPFSQVAIRLSTIFLRQLACDYSVQAVSDGAPIRGAYHWEPARQFCIQLNKRQVSLQKKN
jgi:cytochrome P450